MTIVQTASLAFLVLALVISIWRHINIGVLSLGFSLILVLMMHFSDPDKQAEVVKKMLTAFPGNLFILIVGVSLLFAHLEKSGAIQWLVDKVFDLVGDHVVFLPWAGFLIGALLSTCGAFSTAPIALLVPLMAHLARRFKRSYWLNALAAIMGANSAGLSPLNPTGASVATAAAKAHISYNRWGLWAASMLITAAVVAVIQIIDTVRAHQGHNVVVEPAVMEDAGRTGVVENKPYAVASGIALVAFIIMAVVLRWDVGLSAFLLTLVLSVVFHPNEADLLHRVPWGGILLLAGLLTFLGLLTNIGTMKQIEHAVTHFHGVGLILIIAYLTALLCNIESSTLGVINIMAPIAFAAFGGSPALLGVLIALCVSGALMVGNPIHVAGTLVIANSAEHEQQRVFNKLLSLCVAIALIMPGLLSIYPILVR